MKKKSYEEVKAYIESFSYELLSTEYIRAKENGWRLIRIPYWELDNIEEIYKK